MKIVTFVICFISVLLIGVVWYLKPIPNSLAQNNTNQSQENTQEILTEHQNQKNMPQGFSNQSNSVKPEIHQDLENKPYDTKSDLSIQPIDPEKDSGNEILN